MHMYEECAVTGRTRSLYDECSGVFLKGVMKRQKNYSALICFSYLCPKYIFLLLNCW